MEITEVKVFLVNEEKLKAFVSIVLDRCFMINDIKVIQGREGLFISMPSRRKKNGEFKDVAHPLNNETRRWMEEAILGEYDRGLQERASQANEPADHRDRRQTAASSGMAVAVAPAATGPPVESVSPPAPEASAEAPIIPPHQAPVAQEVAPEVVLEPAAEQPSEEVRSEPSEQSSGEDRTLEEVQEHHLSDSFWSVSGRS